LLFKIFNISNLISIKNNKTYDLLINNNYIIMSFEAYRDREIKYYQDRINQLEQENSLLKNHSCFQHQQPIQHQMDPYANSIYCNFLLI
jgi:aspartate 1-decarboxylase